MIFLRAGFRFLVFSAFFFVLGCSSFSIKKALPLNRALLFPYGLYKHNVTLNLANGQGYNFSGLILTNQQLNSIRAFSQFGNTIFKLQHNKLTNKLDLDVYFEPLNNHKKELSMFYEFLNLLLNTRMTEEDSISLQPTGNAQVVLVDFSDRDTNKIPRIFTLKHPQFSLRAEVTDYDL